MCDLFGFFGMVSSLRDRNSMAKSNRDLQFSGITFGSPGREF